MRIIVAKFRNTLGASMRYVKVSSKMTDKYPFLKVISDSWVRLRGPVIQANGRLTSEDDLRSGGLLCFISMNASIRTELADSMVTPGEPGGD